MFMSFNWLKSAFKRTNINRETGCWEFQGELTTTGYGKVEVDGKAARLHRLSFSFFRNPIPEDLNVCHKCDVRNCWNPDHLFTGTDADNARDMVRKGRSVSKLNPEDILEIRKLHASGVRQFVIAKQFEVSSSAICRIINGSRWGCFDGAAPGTVNAPEFRTPPRNSGALSTGDACSQS